jgi:ribosome biogenesis protein UTP30
MTPSNVVKVVEEAFGRTYVRKNQGNCVVIRVGYAGMSVDELAENVLAVWERCVEGKRLTNEGVDGMRTAFVKSSNSVALPVWAADELFSEKDVLEEGVVEKPKAKSKAERKLLAAPEEGEEEEKEEGGIDEKKGKKRVRADGMERAFEYKRAKKLAKLESSADNLKKVVKA